MSIKEITNQGRLDSQVRQGPSRNNDRLTTMAATSRAVLGAQSFVPDSPVGRNRNRSVCCADEPDRQHNSFPQRAVRVAPHRVAREASRKPAARSHWPSRERHRCNSRNDSLFDGNHYMVAGAEELASQPESKVGIASSAVQLGCTQRTRSLVLLIRSDVGNLRALLFFSTSILCPCIIG